MQLTEIQKGDTLLVKSYYCDQKENGDIEVNFRTNCIDKFSNGIITDEMRSGDGNPINFESKLVCSDVYLLRDGESPIIWRNVIIKRIKLKGKRIHAIVSKLMGTKYNRRGSYRVPVTVKAVARLGASRRTADVYVRDVSETGFSIVTSREDEVHQYDYVRVTFDDFGYRLALTGICIRSEAIGQDKVVYGCTNEGKIEKLDEYIAEKQRFFAQKHHK